VLFDGGTVATPSPGSIFAMLALTPKGALAGNLIGFFAGMAVGNVLLPPLVKRYFPDRVSLVTAVYATVMSVSTLLPPLLLGTLLRVAVTYSSLDDYAYIGEVLRYYVELKTVRRYE